MHSCVQSDDDGDDNDGLINDDMLAVPHSSAPHNPAVVSLGESAKVFSSGTQISASLLFRQRTCR